jgi:hypothetical protein
MRKKELRSAALVRLNRAGIGRFRLLDLFAGKPLLEQALLGIFFVACGAGALAWVGIVTYAIRVPFHAKSGSLHGWFRANPLNVVFYSEKLTPKGLVLRRRLLLSVSCFVGCVAVGVICGLVLKYLTHS